jgi:transcriptional regulator with XRE-family HTH domain
MEIKDRLRSLREEKGLTLDMLVYDLNNKFDVDINKGLVSKWENGRNDPSLKYGKLLAQYYDVSLDYLVGLTDIKLPSRLLAYTKRIAQLQEDEDA